MNTISRKRKKIIIQKAGKCELCEETKHLVLHHKNQNSSDNKPQNLMVLCPTCHHKQPPSVGGEKGPRRRLIFFLSGTQKDWLRLKAYEYNTSEAQIVRFALNCLQKTIEQSNKAKLRILIKELKKKNN